MTFSWMSDLVPNSLFAMKFRTLAFGPLGTLPSTPRRIGICVPPDDIQHHCHKLIGSSMVAVGTRISPRPPHRSGRALLTHRAPPSGQTLCDERFSYVRRSTRSHYSDRRGISAQCPNRGRLTAVPLG